MIGILHLAVFALMAAAFALVVVRLLKGPSIVDRMIASDVLVTLVLLTLVADMVVNRHLRTLPVLIALSGTAVLASVAVARYVSRQDRRDGTGQDGGRS